MEPPVIQKLDQVVVNRIAAGEIIKRPANALKEMIENSLDAHSTNIQITVRTGGLKSLQIRDNGTGIRRQDLEIVCERFTTSKLKVFDDLQTIATYGFRGEALASISHVAHLSIQTKTANDPCAYKASYEDGQLKGDIKSCAGNQGTQITVEDLFYNVPQRKQFFKSPADEFGRIMDVVCKYAVHNAQIGFTLNKQGEGVSLRTPPNSTHQENIRIAFGSNVADDMKSIECEDKQLMFKMFALTSHVKYSSKKFTLLLFINHRLVESTAIKNAIDHVYSVFLPKGSHPFVYMDLTIEPKNLDVNVHPTKHEVNFLYENEIIEKIKEAFESELMVCSEAKEKYTQKLLPGASIPDIDMDDQLLSSQSKDSKIYAKDIIRYDFKEQKLEKFFGKTNKQSLDNNTMVSSDHHGSDLQNDSDVNVINTSSSSQQLIGSQQCENLNVERKQTKLTSILSLRERVEKKCNKQFRKILSDSVFVGCIDHKLSLIQCASNLYVCNMHRLSEELFYQMLLYEFQNFSEIRFENPLSIKDLAVLALNNKESGWCELDGPIDELAGNIQDILLQKADMLKEYYRLSISNTGHLETIPSILDNHMPALGQLPMYILRLATEVDWSEEKHCFESFSRETARFYAHISGADDEFEWQWNIEHIIYDNIKRYLLPSNQLKSKLLPVANLQNLYKVFERC